MKRFFSLIVLLIFFFNCNNKPYSDEVLYNHILEEDVLFLKINSVAEFTNNTKTNKVFQNLKSYNYIDSLYKNVEILTALNFTDKVLIGIDSSSNFTLSTKYRDELTKIDTINAEQQFDYKILENSISEIKLNYKNYFAYAKDSLLFISNSKPRLKQQLLKPIKKEQLKNLFLSLDDEKGFSIVTKSKSLNYLKLINSDITYESEGYYALDLELSDKSTYATGVLKSIDTTNNFIDIFKNTVPQENGLAQVSPKDIDKLVSFTFDNVNTFRSNLNALFNNDKVYDSIVPYFDYANEIGYILKDNNIAVIMKSIDAEQTEESFYELNLIDGYKDVKLFELEDDSLFSQWFYPIVTNPVNLYCRLDEFFVFSSNRGFLENIITNYLNETTLDKANSYISLKNQLNDESSLLVVSNATYFNDYTNSIFTEDKNIKLADNNWSAFQFVSEADYAHVNIAIEEYSNSTSAKGVRELFSINLKNDILNTPQFVINHRTRQKEIFVQDINNIAYLISNTGSILWTKQLHGPILGRVKQIDTYKNGRLQLTFATPYRVYVLDRNGNDVNDFPLIFRDEITQPLSVFDYDKRKDYRLLVTQNSALLMYDKNGKPVNGFKYSGTNGAISSQPKHFRLGRKDYIVFKHGNTLKIINRVGKIRVNPNRDFSFSENDVFLYKNTFTTTSTNGTLIQVDSRGRTNEINLNLNADHSLTASSKTLVTLNDNKLNIRSNTVELPFGTYSEPNFYYLQDKIYVSVTDLETKKVYLFDSQAKAIPSFPVYGNSEIEMDNIDNDNNLEFVVQGNGNSIILYEIN